MQWSNKEVNRNDNNKIRQEILDSGYDELSHPFSLVIMTALHCRVQGLSSRNEIRFVMECS
jgi:hypothetical protein